MTIPVLAALIGAIIWLVFTKVNKISDGWLAELGKLVFFAGILVALFAAANKVAF